MTYDEHTALIVADVQNDFADPRGSLYIEGAESIVPLINRAIERARAAGAIVVYTIDWHPERTPHFATEGGTWPVHCVRYTWGAELHPDLLVVGDLTVRKGTEGEDGYSGFTVRDVSRDQRHPTLLESLLRRHAIARVVLVGIATDYCVKETALDALRLGFETTVIEDAVRAVELAPGDGDRALETIRAAGATTVKMPGLDEEVSQGLVRAKTKPVRQAPP